MADALGVTTEQGLNRRLRASFRQWINRRIPPAREVTLDQRRIFIFLLCI